LSCFRRLAAVLAVIHAGGCPAAQVPASSARGDFTITALRGAPPGLSDLTIDDRGVLWAVAERERALVEMTLGRSGVVVHTIPVEGVPEGVDTEGLVWLGTGRFVMSTEGKYDPSAGLLWLEIRGDHAVVTHGRAFTDAELGVPLLKNQGAEALCGNDRELLVGIETVGTLPDGARYAPIARIRGDTMTIVKFRLTSATGKLSAFACRIDDDGTVHGWAIERHYGVTRILKWSLARAATEVTPAVALDLTAVLHGTRNLEGIVELPGGALALVNDNQSRVLEGPSELMRFPCLTSPSRCN
jgi:hypothetical protein